MTIVLGIKTPQGVVLASDTQESYESHKVSRPKLIFKSDETSVCGLPVTLAIAGAGTGPWLDKVSAEMWDALQDATSLDEASSQIEEKIKTMYSEYRELVSYDLHAELIYGIGASNGTRLFHAYGPIVNELGIKAAGSGQAIADFLMKF